MVDAVAEPQALQHPGAALPHLAGCSVAELRRHLDVFVGGERIEQIVHLKDETDVAPHFDEFAAAELRQVAAEHVDPAFLSRAQCPDQGQQSGLSGPRGAGHHDELTRGNLDRVAEQDLVARFALTVIVVQAVHPHGRFRCGRPRDRRRLRPLGDESGAHQNTSAGSAVITRRTAIAAEIRHIPRVRPRLTSASRTVMCSGNSANRPMT